MSGFQAIGTRIGRAQLGNNFAPNREAHPSASIMAREVASVVSP